MGPAKSGTECPKTRNLIPRGSHYIWRPIVTYISGPEPFRSGTTVHHGWTSNTDRLLLVAHADRGERVRIISARKTTQRERKQYEEENRETE
jgi:hypothetical protein